MMADSPLDTPAGYLNHALRGRWQQRPRGAHPGQETWKERFAKPIQ